MSKTESDRLFEEYLDQNDAIFGYEYEPNLEGRREPDYLVKSKYGEVICEVKGIGETEFAKTLKTHRIAFFDEKSELNPIRNKIHDSADQFREYQELQLPCVAIISNPKKISVELESEEVLQSMFGNKESIFKIDKSGNEPPQFKYYSYGRDGKLTNHHRYISAVAILDVYMMANEIWQIIFDEEKKKTEPLKDAWEKAIELLNRYTQEIRQNKGIDVNKKEFRLRVYHNYLTTIPLTPNIFSCQNDECWIIDKETTSFVESNKDTNINNNVRKEVKTWLEGL